MKLTLLTNGKGPSTKNIHDSKEEKSQSRLNMIRSEDEVLLFSSEKNNEKMVKA